MLSVIPATLPIRHRAWVPDPGGAEDAHGNPKGDYAAAVDRTAIGFYDASSTEPVSSEYVARTVTTVMVQVPDPETYNDQDIIEINGTAFNIEGRPSDWGAGLPWAEYRALFGGVITAKRPG